jgi:hypothetical protein
MRGDHRAGAGVMRLSRQAMALTGVKLPALTGQNVPGSYLPVMACSQWPAGRPR